MHPKIKINRLDEFGLNAFWYACRNKDLKSMDILLEMKDMSTPGKQSKVDITPMDVNDGNCLHLAIKNKWY